MERRQAGYQYIGNVYRLLIPAETKAGVQFARGEELVCYSYTKGRRGCRLVTRDGRIIQGVYMGDIELVKEYDHQQLNRNDPWAHVS